MFKELCILFLFFYVRLMFIFILSFHKKLYFVSVFIYVYYLCNVQVKF